MEKTYLFVSITDYKNRQLTGAHRRFLELVRSVAESNKVILVTREIPQLDDVCAKRFVISDRKIKGLPYHVNGMIDLCQTLHAIKKEISYDYAISFVPSNSICLSVCGYKHIVSLFREDLISYQEVVGASKARLKYFSLMERIAVKKSDLIIVQCQNDRKNLINRTQKYDKQVENKVTIQINNANASWMKCDLVKTANLNNPIPRILFIGGFANSRKGHGILLPAMKKLRDEGYSFELFIAGDGIELDKYKNEYGLDPAFKFLGRVSNMTQYLEIVDFVIVPSLIDSCPNTVLEGLNAGVTVYGSNTGGIPDLLGNKKFLFEPNTDNIYRFIKEVIDEKRYLLDVKEQVHRKELLTFNWGKAVEKKIEGLF